MTVLSPLDIHAFPHADNFSRWAHGHRLKKILVPRQFSSMESPSFVRRKRRPSDTAEMKQVEGVQLPTKSFFSKGVLPL